MKRSILSGNPNGGIQADLYNIAATQGGHGSINIIHPLGGSRTFRRGANSRY